jgi:hypothetical protein
LDEFSQLIMLLFGLIQATEKVIENEKKVGGLTP